MKYSFVLTVKIEMQRY